MSKKNKKSAASALPADMFTFSQASTFGLDGFGFDDPDNEGVEQKARLPEAKGLGRLPGEVLMDAESASAVPEGIQRHADELPDLTAMLEPSVVDLNWLSPPTGTPPERLPHRPVSIPELEEAWGARRTNGVEMLPHNVDLNYAQYQESLEVAPTRKAATREEKVQLRDLIRKAMRKEASGAPAERAINLVKWAAGEDHPALTLLKRDEGLAGNVFIRAAAYPGCANGKWSKHVRKTASAARYVVAAEKCNGCVRNDNGRCQVFRKRVVSKVPWRKAARLYAPKFRAVGHELDTAHPKESLRVAFLKEHKQSPKETAFPHAENPADTVTRKQAGEWLDKRAATPRKVVDVSHREGDRTRVAAQKQLDTWRKNELLSKREHRRLSSYPGNPKDAVRVGAKLIAYRKSAGQYEGHGRGAYGAPVSDKAIGKALQKAAAQREKRQAKFDAAQRKQAVDNLKAHVRKGLMTKKTARKILEGGYTPEEMAKLAAYVVVREQQAETRKVASQSKAGEYVGAGQGAIPNLDGISTEEACRRVKMAHTRKASKREVYGLLRYVDLKMNEGSAGHELDQLITTMYSAPLVKAASEKISRLRDKHEGLAGHLYVKASAYASEKGVKGCEEGALRHRGNGIGYVLSMRRCGSCVHRNAENFCQKYAKPLTREIPHEDPKGLQLEMIRQANASDAETTASMFAPSGASAIAEFGLQDNSALDGFDFYASSPGDQPAEKLGEILWGGFEYVDQE